MTCAVPPTNMSQLRQFILYTSHAIVLLYSCYIFYIIKYSIYDNFIVYNLAIYSGILISFGVTQHIGKYTIINTEAKYFVSEIYRLPEGFCYVFVSKLELPGYSNENFLYQAQISHCITDVESGVDTEHSDHWR